MTIRSCGPVALLMFVALCTIAQNKKSQPNFVIILTDDQGYGDLGCYGHPTIKTPNIDRMALEGQRWTSFYSAANVCTPSRAGLLTGRLAIRSGMCGDRRRVLFPDSEGGLPQGELTLAELLKDAGYHTAAVGKWHLGHLPEYLPAKNGFDSYFGIPYSNDMDRINALPGRESVMNPQSSYFNVPLMRNKEIVERPADQNTITKRYTEEAVRFIRENRKEPFFLYLAHNLPHVPLFASDAFRGRSERGLYGDVIEEIDWSVGRILDVLREEKLDKNTIVIFTSDNGPWALYNEQGGSAGLLLGAKGTGYEGGQRVPGVWWGPGTIRPQTVTQIGSSLDIMPTIASMAGLKLPSDRKYDGYDLSNVLKGTGPSPRDEMFYYHGTRLFAARKGDFKLHFYENNPIGNPQRLRELDTLKLFNLAHDPSERYDIASENPGMINKIRELVTQHRATVDSVQSQLEKKIVSK